MRCAAFLGFFAAGSPGAPDNLNVWIIVSRLDRLHYIRGEQHHYRFVFAICTPNLLSKKSIFSDWRRRRRSAREVSKIRGERGRRRLDVTHTHPNPRQNTETTHTQPPDGTGTGGTGTAVRQQEYFFFVHICLCTYTHN